MLSQFKKGIEENIDEADAQAHYDLGVAFKEMGLLDEAISEFQKALRSDDTRLRAAESLGLCFYEKGQLQVAATVMRRAVDADKGGDEAKIGLLYWLGRCEEEQSKTAEALVYYQRAFAVDIKFQDVGERVSTLSKAGH
jgi:tetratricopeptide (TPR) repeat protein